MALTQETLRAIIHYDPIDGIFRWIVAPQRSKIGDVAGFFGGPGYWQIRIKGKLFYAHRLAFLYMIGSLPSAAVDHIDGNKTNNRWRNLRAATIRQNAANSRKRLGKTSALKGAIWDARRSTWVSFIRINGRSTYLGTFDTELAAHEAYCVAATSTFGQFARVA